MVRPASVSGCPIRCPSLCHWHYVHFQSKCRRAREARSFRADEKTGRLRRKSPATRVPRVPVRFRARKASAALALCKVWMAALQLWVYLKGFFCVAFVCDVWTIGNLKNKHARHNLNEPREIKQ